MASRPVWTLTQTAGRNVVHRLEELDGWSQKRIGLESKPYGRLAAALVSRVVRGATSDRPDGKNPDLRISELLALARTLGVSPAWLVTPRFGDVRLPGDGLRINKQGFKAWWSGERGLDGEPLEESNNLLRALAEEISDAYDWSLSDDGYVEFMKCKRLIDLHLDTMERSAHTKDPHGAAKWAAHQRREAASEAAVVRYEAPRGVTKTPPPWSPESPKRAQNR